MLPVEEGHKCVVSRFKSCNKSINSSILGCILLKYTILAWQYRLKYFSEASIIIPSAESKRIAETLFKSVVS